MVIIRYNNYHKHTHYSNIRTLDCISKPIDYINRALELGHTTYFTGEHGFQGNIYEAQTLCEANGLKCIYSVEAYYVDDINNREDRITSHIILVAMTEQGRKDINKIMSIANTDGYYYRPRIDLNLLLSLNPNDVVVTTACVASRMNKDDWFELFFLPVKNHFKEHFFLEVQPHNVDIQKEYNRKLLAISKKYNVKLIHANDSHYIYPQDSKYRELFLFAKNMHYDDEDSFVLDYPTSDEIIERYKIQGILNDNDIYDAINNTLIFDNAESINIDKEFKIPKITNEDPNTKLRELVYQGFDKYKKYVKPDKIDEYIKEIEYELKIVKDCDMAMYFILNQAGVDKAVNEYQAVLTRSGRGSAVSFIINKFLGLTQVDRIKAPVTLYPTRFMSAERILASRSLPDVDLNFANVKPVIQAFKDLLGDDGIYYMLVYKPLQESSAFRLMCKAKGLEHSSYNEVAKELDKYKDTPEWRDLYKESQCFVGVIESIAPSPCSFLLLDKPISEEVGLIKVKEEICCCLDGYNCDSYKYVKNDLLTVTVYDIIDKVYKRIGRPIDDIATLINNCDEKVWDIYARGLTTTVNQSDSDFAKHLLTRYKPKNLAEMTAFVAAIRPGFASLLDNFLDRKPYSTKNFELDTLLKDSFHYMLYQESIMKYLIWLGVEEKETYDIIKKISKKKFTEKELNNLETQLEQEWINKTGSIKNFANTWQVVNDAARYSFNASHALSVAIDSLYGAYLKANYPLEYFTVALSIYDNDQDKSANLIKEMNYFGVTLKNAEYGKSTSEYLEDKSTNTIYKSVSSIKFLNKINAEKLYDIANRFEGISFLDLLQIIDNETTINIKQLNALIQLDFFKSFGNANELLFINQMFIFFKKGQANSLSEKKIQGVINNFSDDFFNLIQPFVSNIGANGNTLKTYKILDCQSLMKALQKAIYEKGIYDLTYRQKMKVQEEFLGYIDLTTNKEEDRKKLIVLEVKAMKNPKGKIWGYVVVTQSIGSGKKSSLTLYPNIYKSCPIHKLDIIYVEQIHKNNKGYWYLDKYYKIND